MGEAKRKQSALRQLGAMSLEEHVDDFRARVGSEFRRQGEVRHRLEAVTGTGEVFEIDTTWHDLRDKETVRRALPGSLRRRGVTRYLVAMQAWQGSREGVRPSEDPDRSEGVIVIAVERGGARRYLRAEIKQTDERPVLGEWENVDEVRGWMIELLDGADTGEQPLAVPVLDEPACARWSTRIPIAAIRS